MKPDPALLDAAKFIVAQFNLSYPRPKAYELALAYLEKALS